jgi:hypothetical protein
MLFRRRLVLAFRGTSLIRNRTPIGLYSRTMPKGPVMVVRVWAVFDERGTPVAGLGAHDVARAAGTRVPHTQNCALPLRSP